MKQIKQLFRKPFCLLVGLSAAVALTAQQTYTLDECIDRALQNNARMKNAGNDLQAAELQRKSAFTNYFPSVSATGIGFVADRGLMQMELSPDMQMSMLKDGLMGGVTATMPLFAGGQIVQGNQLAKVNVEVNRLKHRQTTDEVRLTTEQYFWQVAMLKEKLRLNKYIANSTGFICAATTNWLLNRIWTFQSHDPQISRQYLLFLAISLIGLGINNGIIYLLADRGKLNFYLSKLLAIGVVTIWNFLMNFFFTFNA